MERHLGIGSNIMFFMLSIRYWPNSFNAHRLMEYARSIHFDKLKELNARLFEMTYEEGKNISSVEELVVLGNTIGLKGVEEMLRSNQFEKEVIEEDDFAKEDLEIQFSIRLMLYSLEEFHFS